jgi:hypothetical protein
MKPTKDTELNSDLEALRASVSIDDAKDLDRHRSEQASTFNELRYLDTRPIQHLTATWGN